MKSPTELGKLKTLLMKIMEKEENFLVE